MLFLWIVVAGGIYSFIAAMGIGSNDAANAFATSVGSKALTLRQAAGLAVIFETGGAILMGNHVTDTIRKGIADYECFEENPELLMYGCMWVIASVAVWLFLASYWEMPVSTTHSCVGGMIGMTIALKGTDCVIWYKPVDTFPYVGGVSGIVASWVISPVFSGIISSVLFAIIRSQVLRKSYETKRLNILYPILVGSTLTINSFFIIYKGAKGLGLHNTPIGWALLISFGAGGVGGLITYPFVPKLKHIVNKKISKTNTVDIELEGQNIEDNKDNLNIRSETQLTKVKNLHENAEKFDRRTEEMFKYLQIFSAICDSFSHGANDVANAIGPFAAIYTIYKSGGNLSRKTDMDNDAYWILAMGGVGIGVGLIIYGKKIVHAIGDKLCKITPSRGTIIELSSALIIITGSRLKIPLSTTHCQVGATVGVGLLENKCGRNGRQIQGVNCYILAKTAFGWVITCVVVGVFTGLLVAQGTYGPTVNEFKNCDNNLTTVY